MLIFKTFSHYVHTNFQLQPVTLSFIGNDGATIPQWSAALGRESIKTQCQQIEQLLAELNVALMDDDLRLNIMVRLMPVIHGAVSQLHTFYVNESLVLTKQQQYYTLQVNSLYYLSILVYQGILDRVLQSPNHGYFNKLKQLMHRASKPEKLLVTSICCLCHLYVRLLLESAIVYQQPPQLYWALLNKNYLLAQKHNCFDEVVIGSMSHSQKICIRDFYLQACLFSLLPLNTYRRRDILALDKVLMDWAIYLKISDEPNANVKAFVNPNSSQPPQYLKNTGIIDEVATDNQHYFFIDTSPLEHYLSQLLERCTADVSYRLALMTAESLKRQYQQQQHRKTVSESAVLIFGLDLIHYYLAGRSSLYNVIVNNKIAKVHQPRSNTKPKTYSNEHQLKLKIIEIGKHSCRAFVDYAIDEQDIGLYDSIQVRSFIAIKRTDSHLNYPCDNSNLDTHTMGTPDLDNWVLGLIHSIDISNDVFDITVQIMATTASVCAVRLENNDGRRQDFVAALLLAGSETLGTNTTLVLPKYHFKTSDKVVLRIGEAQTVLLLQQAVLKTDDIEQYLIVRAAKA